MTPALVGVERAKDVPDGTPGWENAVFFTKIQISLGTCRILKLRRTLYDFGAKVGLASPDLELFLSLVGRRNLSFERLGRALIGGLGGIHRMGR